MKYLALICARGGSKGLPKKNILPLNGVPLIGWSIGVAKKVDRVSKIVVSTDSIDIAKVAIEYGAEVPFMRPKELAQDTSPEWEVWRHAIKYLETNLRESYDAIVVLPATSPLRSVDDVNSCIDLFENENENVDSIITVSEAYRNPYFNMILNNEDGYASIVIKDKKKIIRRQDAPEIYDITTVAYVVKTDFVKNFNNIFDGKVKSILVPRERALDIDDAYDFKFAESLINKLK